MNADKLSLFLAQQMLRKKHCHCDAENIKIYGLE